MRTVKKKSWNPIRTMRLIIFSQPSVFVRADLRAHSFGFILTSPGLVRLVLFGSNTPCKSRITGSPKGDPKIGKLTPMVPTYLFFGLQKAVKKRKK